MCSSDLNFVLPYPTGIAPARVTPVGYGKTKFRYPNTGEENRARNRRVEIVITLNADEAGTASPPK